MRAFDEASRAWCLFGSIVGVWLAFGCASEVATSPEPTSVRQEERVRTMAIVGVGRLGTALAEGWRRSEAQSLSLTLVQRNLQRCSELREQGFDEAPHEVVSSVSSYEAFDVVLIAVSPRDTPAVLRDVLRTARTDALLGYVAAGVMLADVTFDVPAEQPFFRFHSTPFVASGAGSTQLVFATEAARARREEITALFTALGRPFEVVEEEINRNSYYALTTSVLVSALLEGLLADEPEAVRDARGHLALEALEGLLGEVRAKVSRGESVSSALHGVRESIVTPGGKNAALLDALERLGVVDDLRTARDAYLEHDPSR